MSGIDGIETEFIRCEIDDLVAVVTLDRPPVNAQDRQVQEELMLVFDVLSDREDVRAVVLTGAGRIFSAGADMKSRAGQAGIEGAAFQHNRRARESFHAVRECRKPVIGAINGPALGAGLALAASCDILVAADTATLGLPEINVGLLGGGRHAMRLFGHSRTRRMMFTGYRVDGPELLRLGVVEACVPADQLMDTAMELAREIASKSPIAMNLAKHALNAIEEMSLRDGYRFEQEMTERLSHTEDAKEAAQAFLENREPRFVGR